MTIFHFQSAQLQNLSPMLSGFTCGKKSTRDLVRGHFDAVDNVSVIHCDGNAGDAHCGEHTTAGLENRRCYSTEAEKKLSIACGITLLSYCLQLRQQASLGVN